MELNKVGVIGCGTMGSGIAYVSALNGYNVCMLDISREILERAIASLHTFAEKSIEKGKLSDEERENVFRRLKATTDYGDLADCDIVIEAVAEKISVKRSIFEKLEKTVRKETILASNTSSLSINEISSAVASPERVLGLHFFNPPQLMKLVELIKGEKTSPEVASAAKLFSESLGKTVVSCADNPGFIVNYLQYPFRLNAIRMVEKGLATPEDIDTAAKLALGHKMGPLELQDMVGLDITYNGCMEVYEKTEDPVFKPPKLMEDMIKENRLGRKTGIGFYKYK